MRMRNVAITAMLAAGLTAGAGPKAARAEDGRTLNIATGGAFSSLDPHYHNLTPNNVLADYIFAGLVRFDPGFHPEPSLAVSWKAIDDKTWEFKLRDGVTFHDGTPFTAADVVFSFARIPTVLNSPSSFNFAVKTVTSLEVIDPLTIRMHTAAPAPLIPYMMTAPRIVSHHAAEGATTADFNSGKAAIGTGPYRLVSVTLGDRVVFRRNDAWWDKKPVWENVVYRVIANDGSRSAALQAGDVDVIDQVPTRDVPTLEKNPKIAIFSSSGLRLIYISPDAGREQSPFVLDLNGNKLPNNPLRDPRVRKALSLAINREGIRTQIMDGFAKPTGQLVPEGISGYDPAIKVDPYDPKEAKRLLAEAGYPNGFAITLHGPNDRYINDRTIEEAVAQMWTRIGVKTTVNSMPSSVFFSTQARDEFSIWLIGWSSDTGEGSSPLVQIVASSNPAKGWGGGATFHPSHFSDPAIDTVIEQALSTLDTPQREALYNKATEMAVAQTAFIPLHHQVNVWAMRKGLQMNGGMLEGTRAWYFEGVGE